MDSLHVELESSGFRIIIDIQFFYQAVDLLLLNNVEVN